MAHVFISYVRKDGAAESARVDEALQAKGINTWRDNRIDPNVDFTGEIEGAIDVATHVVVIQTPDLKRPDSFVRKEIAYARWQKKPIVPLLFPDGHREIDIINHTYIDFADWDAGLAELLERLEDFNVREIDPKTRRGQEIAYLQTVAQQYRHWRDLYTGMAATARIEEPKVKLKPAAQRWIEMRHSIHLGVDHSREEEKGKTVRTESLDELREGMRNYRRVALVGDPGAGKTTTLERLAYDYADAAAQETGDAGRQPLPLFVDLGKYTGGDFTQFVESAFGSLRLADCLPDRVVLLLDGLNEMPPAYHGSLVAWLKRHDAVATIASCRKLEYAELKLPLQRVDVLPLDLERIRLFMGNYLLEDDDRETLFWALAGPDARRAWDWYRARKDGATYRDFFSAEDEPGYSWEPERKLLDDLRNRFREQERLPDMLDVVTNPFLLHIAIETYALSGEAPRCKGDLFGRFVADLMEQRGKKAVRSDRAWIGEATQKRALAALAYQMQRDPKIGTSVSAAFANETFRQAAPDADPDLLLCFAVSANILEQTGTVRFSHQLLQEYFAAYEMGEDLRRGVPASKYFPAEDWWTRTGWEETAVLLGGMRCDAEQVPDATQVVEWLTPLQPDLAWRVATESGAPCSPRALQNLHQPPPGERRSPYAVAEWGRVNHEQDRRPGVGLRPDGLPDIQWCDVHKPREGAFIMGSDDQSDNPRREVKQDYSFKIAKYLITYRQFQAFADSEEYRDPAWWRGFPDGYRPQEMAEQNNRYDNHPRDNVSWYQAVAFTRWLDHKYRQAGLIPPLPKAARGEGQGVRAEVRLPTEQEWEYAARGTDGRQYPWGDGYRVGYANVDEQELGAGPYFLNRTTAVGIYPQGAAACGALDMAGNLWEWCLNDYEKPEVLDGYGSGAIKVLRGGSFVGGRDVAACACRGSGLPDGVWLDGGLRVVLSAPIGAL